jgi:hypothetical protein
MVIAVVVLVVVVVGAVLYAAYWWNKRHRDRLQAWANSKGWSYEARDDTYCSRWSGQPFGIGHTRRAKNVMTGMLGGRAGVAFDYSYEETNTDSNGSHDTTYRFSVYALALPCGLPTVSVGPEGFFSKVGHALGMDDIELESEDFNRAFRLTGNDRKLAYDLLPARNMELLLGQRKIHLRTQSSHLLCFDKGWLLPEEIERRLVVMNQFLDNVPSFVWKDHGAATEGGG